MGAGDLTQGRRVETIDDLELPGDYALRPEGDDGKPSLWFLLPRADEFVGEPENEHVIPHFDRFWRGTHRINSLWTITEETDGTVTVSPSILTSTNYGEARTRIEWHGFLERGVWREV